MKSLSISFDVKGIDIHPDPLLDPNPSPSSRKLTASVYTD